MGGVEEGFFGPTVEELAEDITSLLAGFDPATNERYTKVERRIYPPRDQLFRKGILTLTHAVAWSHSIDSDSKIEDPLAVRLYAELKPCVWVTDDLRFLHQYPISGDWTIITLDEVPISYYANLRLGLRGDFESIDRHFEAACREYAAEAVDMAIREVNEHPFSSLGAILLPPVIDIAASDFQWRRQQCIETLLSKKIQSA